MLRATTACTFSTSQLPKVVRTWCVLYILTWKCASRHNGVHFFICHLASSLRTPLKRKEETKEESAKKKKKKKKKKKQDEEEEEAPMDNPEEDEEDAEVQALLAEVGKPSGQAFWQCWFSTPRSQVRRLILPSTLWWIIKELVQQVERQLGRSVLLEARSMG